MNLTQIRSTDGTGTLSYLLVDEDSGNAAMIDPNIEDLQVVTDAAGRLNARITHVIDTHTHADHVSAAAELKRITGATVVMHENTKHKWKIVDQGDRFGIGDILRANAAVGVDRFVHDGDVIAVGNLTVSVLFTPGHTDNHISLLVDGNLFTGDLLLIGQAGRSDLPGGNPREQYDSLFHKVLTLPGSVRVHPGHDYSDQAFTTLDVEKKTNPFLRPMTEDEYVAFVADYFPPVADAGDDGKVVLQCGTKRVTTATEGFRDVSAQQLTAMIAENRSLFLLDVREPFELIAFGAIPGVINISIGELGGRLNELPTDKSAPLAVICQSGNRSAEAAHFLVSKGYSRVYNLDRGTSSWIAAGYPAARGPAVGTLR